MFLYNKTPHNKAFTLIELMVVVAIITIMMTVFLLGRNKLSDQLTIKNQIFTMAGNIRQAQSYSLAVRADSGNFNTSYGVQFNACDNPARTYYYLFTDQNKNGYWDTGEPKQQIDYVTGFKARRIYLKENVSGAWVDRMYPPLTNPSNCNNFAGGDTKPTIVSLTFVRPSPIARVSFFSQNGTNRTNPSLYAAPICVEMENANDATQKMFLGVEETGQVSIKTGCP
jgi:prepilin-type N-terminal cleavage/methylation domain-containing protein